MFINHVASKLRAPYLKALSTQTQTVAQDNHAAQAVCVREEILEVDISGYPNCTLFFCTASLSGISHSLSDASLLQGTITTGLLGCVS